MKVIIAGSRHLLALDHDIDKAVQASGFDVTEVVCGGARGVDAAGKRWADGRMIPVTYFDANWELEGKMAGHLRNHRMADYADALILIWDGKSRGSASMRQKAVTAGLPIHEVIV